MTTLPTTPNTPITYTTRHRVSRWLRANTWTALLGAAIIVMSTSVFVYILGAYGYDTGYLKVVYVAVLVGMLLTAIRWLLAADSLNKESMEKQSEKTRSQPWPLFTVRLVARVIIVSLLFTLMFTAVYDYVNFNHVLVAYGASSGGWSLLGKVRRSWPGPAWGLVDLVLITLWSWLIWL